MHIARCIHSVCIWLIEGFSLNTICLMGRLIAIDIPPIERENRWGGFPYLQLTVLPQHEVNNTWYRVKTTRATGENIENN